MHSKMSLIYISFLGLYVILHLSGMNKYKRQETKIVWSNHEGTEQTKIGNEHDSPDDEKESIPSPKQYNRSVDKTPKPSPIYPPVAVNIYNISSTEVTDTSLCVQSHTPSVFTICTWDLQKDKYVSGDIQNTGQWEPGITRKIYDVLKQSRNVTFIDIGANLGYFSLLAASIGHPVVSVEPWERHTEKFAKSIRINKFEDRIILIKNAVSYNRRVVRIDVPRPDNKGAARLISEKETVHTSNSFYATSITLNDLTSFISTKDVVIKIDIEGHECRALEMSDKLFDGFNVLFISMEWVVMQLFKDNEGVACQTEGIQKMVEMLTRRGFVPYSFSNNKRLDTDSHETWTYTDIYWKRKPF